MCIRDRVHHGLEAPAPVAHVAHDAAHYAHVGVRVHEDLDVQQLAEARVLEYERCV